MDRICKAMRRNQKGFTLVELMVVLLIIGILVAVAVPIYNASRKAAEKRACQSNLRILDGAAQQYRADNGNFPSDPYNNADFKNYLKGGNIPNCPTTGNKYDYDPANGIFTCNVTDHKYP